MTSSETKVMIVILSTVFIAMVAIAFMHYARSITQDEIDSCDDSVCQKSINRQIANEEIMNQTNNATHHSLIIFSKP